MLDSILSQFNKSVLGLDIGRSAIKVVQLKNSPEGLQMSNFGMVPTPLGAVEDGMVLDQDAVANAIREAVAKSGIRAKKTIVAVAGQDIVVRQIKMPYMSEKELENSIIWEAEQHIPIPIEEAVIDYQVMGDYEKDGKREMEVMVAAAYRKVIESHIDTLELAGLNPDVIEVQPFTLLRSLGLEKQGQNRSGDVVALVDIGAGTTDIVIFKGEILRSMRIIQIAGNRLTETIAQTFNLDFARAEQVKIESACAVQDLVAHDERGLKIYNAIKPVFDEIMVEIRRSIDFFRVNNRTDEISKVLLTGGTAKVKGFDRFLRDELGLPVEIGNPLRTVRFDPRTLNRNYLEEIAPRIAVSVGLAMREVTQK